MPKRVEPSALLTVPDQVTIAWLIRHVPITGWVLIVSTITGTFSIGVTAGRTFFPKEVATIQPVPIVTKDELKARLDKLIEGYNANTNRITTGIVDEERNGAAPSQLVYEREAHQAAAQRLRELLKQEHEQFQRSLSALSAVPKQ